MLATYVEAYKHSYGHAAGGLTEARDRPKLVDWCFMWISILWRSASIRSSSNPFLFTTRERPITFIVLKASVLQLLLRPGDPVTYSMMSLMVWLMMCFTVSVSSSAIPCSPMLKDASLVLPSYLRNKTFHRNVMKYKSTRQTVRYDTAGV